MPTLNNAGINLHYEVHGQGPVLLMSHGFSATSRMWDGQIAPLSRNHTLVLWDMRGHGQSDYPADPAAYSEEATVSDMVAKIAGSTKVVIPDAGHAANIDQPEAFNTAVLAFLKTLD